MSIISLLVILIVIGIILWAITTYLPMPRAIKNIILIVGIAIALLYVLSAFGLIDSLRDIRVPRIR